MGLRDPLRFIIVKELIQGQALTTRAHDTPQYLSSDKDMPSVYDSWGIAMSSLLTNTIVILYRGSLNPSVKVAS